jgi:hypothetical protein
MGVTVRKKDGQWCVFTNHEGKRKAKCVGENRAAADKVKRILEARLALDGAGVLDEPDAQTPTFSTYADQWLRDYVRLECKTSTARGYESVLRLYLRPRFDSKRIDQTRGAVSKS